ncbi:MAG: PQQ-dependent sugar dehydrogenase, partial [Myxococcales bacterium]|nr:PQQ-dependent sugar dehydrogenase [Myxococcales bacterium]
MNNPGMARLRARFTLWFVLAVTWAAALLALRQRQAFDLFESEESDRIAPAVDARAPAIGLLKVAEGFERVTDLQFVPGQAGVAVVLEQVGRARLVRLQSGVVVKPGPGLLSVSVRAHSELGLLGLAFHPGYAENGRLFIHYTPKDGAQRSVVAEWRLPLARLGISRAEPHREVLTVMQPYSNHNGGQLVFGPDGYLYIGFGDGGRANDPHGHGQNRATLLGAMLRIDVDAPEGPYGIPSDNPFAAQPKVRSEIWAFGLRNPWRYSFDPAGRLIVADVGQNRYEEIDIVASGDNLGWNVREGRHCFRPRSNCRTQGLVDPIFEYGRGLGSSVTGGFVYTGAALPALEGKYIFGDFASGRIWAMALPPPEQSAGGQARGSAVLLGRWPYALSTFARDEQGELYVADFTAGAIYRLVP